MCVLGNVHYQYHIIICGSGTDVAIFLCGNTCPPLMYISSLTMTSSPNTVVPSILTQRPTQERQPTIQFSNQECDRILASRKIVVRFMQTPAKNINIQIGLFQLQNKLYHLQQQLQDRLLHWGQFGNQFLF